MTKKRFREKTLPAAVMVGPVTLWLILLVAVPLIYILVMSFCSIDQYYNVTFHFTVDNYRHLIDASYIKIYMQSLVIALLTTLICIVVAYPFTYIIARTKSRFKTFVYACDHSILDQFVDPHLWMEIISWNDRLAQQCSDETSYHITAA